MKFITENWKSSVLGVIAAAGAWIVADPSFFPPMLVSAAKFFFPAAIAALGYVAQDKQK